MASQPHRKLGTEMVPLHVHPDAQRLRNGVVPDRDNLQSVIHVSTESNWDSVAPRDQMATLRDYAVLTVKRQPNHPGLTKFDEETMSAFTHPNRLAYIQGEHLTTVSIDRHSNSCSFFGRRWRP